VPSSFLISITIPLVIVEMTLIRHRDALRIDPVALLARRHWLHQRQCERLRQLSVRGLRLRKMVLVLVLVLMLQVLLVLVLLLLVLALVLELEVLLLLLLLLVSWMGLHPSAELLRRLRADKFINQRRVRSVILRRNLLPPVGLLNLSREI
jgi:hypothetical protein